MKPRNYLTKSIFKIGLECPRKLFYLNKPDEYANDNEEDPFLQALAKGGYQVGALATLKYPSGIEITEKDHKAALEKTDQLLKQDCILFEAAFSSGPFFVRSDIVLKFGNNLRIIEVKSKSFDPSDVDGEFLSSRDSKPGAPKVLKEWSSYLYDIAFQVWVARKAYPHLEVSASFMGIDKTSVCSESGLHQMFLIRQNGRQKEVVLTKTPEPDFSGFNILKEVDITDLVNHIIAGQETSKFAINGSFEQKTSVLGDLYLNNKRVPSSPLISSQCKQCEFRSSGTTLKSGFDECWIEATNIEAASSKQLAFDLWNYRGTDKAFQSRKFMLADLEDDDLGSGKTTERQLIQLTKHKNNDPTPWFDLNGLRSEIQSWTFPLHFIDFETCMPAIPFHEGMPPYSEIAFQFSHHIMDAQGNVRHAGQFINLEPGAFPTFDFVRELKRQLSQDSGTIFRYSSHENSVLSRALFLLERSKEVDKDELIAFIKTVTSKKKDSRSKDYLWQGSRLMVDLLELTKLFYYSPLTGGSNSLKFVLPAVLKESSFLQQKYSQPIYGTLAMPSLNFSNHAWLGSGNLSDDPYKTLPEVFSSEEMGRIENILSEEDSIRNGGAAMMAYCKCQYTQMSAAERNVISGALLKYCELDTLAMVMLVEYWMDIVRTHK